VTSSRKNKGLQLTSAIKNTLARGDAGSCQPVPSMTESLIVKTTTRAGRKLTIREMRLADAKAIHACMVDPRFAMPYLTGTPDPRARPVRPWARSIAYVIKAVASRRLGGFAFGARRHWIMAITDGQSGRFLGVVLLDAVVRFPPGASRGFLTRMAIEQHKATDDELVGDAEWGFFLHPDFWGQGIALQAVYALTGALANRASWCAPGRNVVRRVWATTGSSNRQAIALLTKAGLVRAGAKTIPVAMSPRFEPDGRPIELIHFEQPAEHDKLDPDEPVQALLRELENRGAVAPGWQSVSVEHDPSSASSTPASRR
jgi:RimJ/RimL family protein N-acetyltransferase